MNRNIDKRLMHNIRTEFVKRGYNSAKEFHIRLKDWKNLYGEQYMNNVLSTLVI